MLDWDKLRIFHTAAESGSFTHAAEKLGGTISIDYHTDTTTTIALTLKAA